MSTEPHARTIVDRWRGTAAFFRAFLAAPDVVGAALPSSRSLALALLAPMRARTAPVAILEIGAGTGAVTRHLVQELGPHDRLSICEIRPDLMAHIERNILGSPSAIRARADRRITLFNCPAQELPTDQPYDYIVSGLPFTAFSPVVVREILDHVAGLLRPGGVFSYFEYIALRRLRAWTSIGQSRKRVNELSAILDAAIDRHQFHRATVLANFPPAFARHLRFR
ncbi:MAG: methyltransferase domain-containing protein [Phycisphaerales bacterium]|nr:methyltransferase domain-containing protein [Phycisphaerales bacterium]